MNHCLGKSQESCMCQNSDLSGGEEGVRVVLAVANKSDAMLP